MQHRRVATVTLLERSGGGPLERKHQQTQQVNIFKVDLNVLLVQQADIPMKATPSHVHHVVRELRNRTEGVICVMIAQWEQHSHRLQVKQNVSHASRECGQTVQRGIQFVRMNAQQELTESKSLRKSTSTVRNNKLHSWVRTVRIVQLGGTIRQQGRTV